MTDEVKKPIDEPQGALEGGTADPAMEGGASVPSTGPLAEAAESNAEDTQAGEPQSTAAVEEQPAAVEEKAEEVTEETEEKAKEKLEETVEAEVEAEEPEKKDWYILKVQSNREDSIREGLLRRIAVAGLEDHFGDVIVPTEKITEVKGGKKRVMKRKLYPGYLVVQMEINEDTWFLVRETPGIGDFTGAAGTPTPMLPHEVSRILARQEEKPDEAPKLKIGFSPGDRVKIIEGTFENFEGEVDSIDESSGRVTVMINIFGRSTPVELEYWQIDSL